MFEFTTLNYLLSQTLSLVSKTTKSIYITPTRSPSAESQIARGNLEFGFKSYRPGSAREF